MGKYVGGAIEADLSESMTLGEVIPEASLEKDVVDDEGVWGGVNSPWGGAADEVVVVVVAVVVGGGGRAADEEDEEGTSAGESMGREEVVAVTSEAPNVRLTVSVVAAPGKHGHRRKEGEGGERRKGKEERGREGRGSKVCQSNLQ